MGVLAHPVTSEFPIGSVGLVYICLLIYHKNLPFMIHGSVNISVPWILMGLSFAAAPCLHVVLCFPNRPNLLQKQNIAELPRCPRWNMQHLPLQPMCSEASPKISAGKVIQVCFVWFLLPRCTEWDGKKST